MRDIVPLAKRHQIRLHAEACFGGSLLLSDRMQHLFDGIDEVDSLTRNPHKMLASSQTTSILMVRHPATAEVANSLRADYLFGQE